jgi:hypothetical protein
VSGGDEAVEDRRAFGKRGPILLQRPQALFVGGRALAQAGAEQ